MNVFDVILVLIVLAATFYGWRTGVIRQVVAIAAAMFAFMVADQIYEPFGTVLSQAAGIGRRNFFDGLAYLLLMCLAAAGFFLIVRRLYPYTGLAEPEQGGAGWYVDQIGGILLGAVLGVLLAVATVGVIEVLVYYHWPGFLEEGPRDQIHESVRGALLVRGLFSDAPAIAEVIGHWVPGVLIVREGRILP